MELMGFRGLGSKQASPKPRVVVVCPKPPPGRPLIYMGDARRFTESRRRFIDVSGSVSTIPNLQYKLHTDAGLRLQALNRLWALSPHLPSWALTYSTTDEVNPACPGRFTPSNNIPNRTGLPNHCHHQAYWFYFLNSFISS